MSVNLHRLTPTPPLGWNSYDSFGCFINEKRALENLRVFVERLKPHGYAYFVIDAGWYRMYELDGREFPRKENAYTFRHDAYGRPVPAPCFFPNGLAPLVEACHAAGVKFGLHMMRGIPRAAVEANTPIAGTSVHARAIANTADTCSWCPDNYGVDMTRPGAQAYYDSVIDMLAGWGVDFIKYDDIVPSPPEVDAVVQAIGKCGRDIVLSLSPGNGHNADGWPSYFKANMIRTSGDIWDSREDFRWVFERWQSFMPLLDQLPPGCWLDMDMIPFGELQVWNPAKGEQVGHILMNGKGAHRMSGLNEPQKRTFMTMRALAASPLFMGGNLPGTDDYSFHLLTDPGMLACNQNGVTGKLISYTDWTSTWLTPHRLESGAGWIGIFNRDGDNPRDIVVDAAVLGIAPESRLTDVWTGRELGNLSTPMRLILPPDEVLFLKYQGSPAMGRDPRKQVWVQSTKPELEGKLGTTFSLSNGLLGLRGAHEECPAWGRPEFYVAGTYAGGPSSLLGFHDPDHILTHPDRITPEALKTLKPDVIWTLPNLPFPVGVRLAVGGEPFTHESMKVLSNERLLDMDRAVVRRCLVFRDAAGRRTRVDSQRFVSMADRNLVCQRYTVRRLDHEAPLAVEGFLKTDVTSPNGVVLWTTGRMLNEPGRKAVECVTRVSERRVVVAQHGVSSPTREGVQLDLFAVAGEMDFDEALARVEEAARKGYKDCLRAHVAAVAAERAGGLLACDADWATVQGLNFGLLHLNMAIGPLAAKTGVPIKGLTGHGYRFLNFWDMDFHMFPFYLMTAPDRARDLLVYRYNQLNAYRENARRWGAKGAQVPWETNTRGEEETAPWLCLQEREIHISADAAWMFRMYAEVTGDSSVLDAMGAEFIMEMARFYSSRIRWVAARNRYELPDIGCPDQYHTFADNNVFISLMARWNLEYAAGLAADPRFKEVAGKIGLLSEEVEEWRKQVAGLFIQQPDSSGVIEEFDGFHELEPDLEGITESYCRHSQAVKQPDVLAATVRFENVFSNAVRRANWRYYNDRTLNGSSLSLPGMAFAASRCGLNDEALYNLHKSARMDLDDVNLDTERGVHVSGTAVAWQAIVFGFGGLTPTAEALEFRPNLPRQWDFLDFTVHWHGQRVRIEIRKAAMTIHVGTRNDASVVVKVGDDAAVTVPSGSSRTWDVRSTQ